MELATAIHETAIHETAMQDTPVQEHPDGIRSTQEHEDIGKRIFMRVFEVHGTLAAVIDDGIWTMAKNGLKTWTPYAHVTCYA